MFFSGKGWFFLGIYGDAFAGETKVDHAVGTKILSKGDQPTAGEAIE